jgi:hypothetical protein
MKKAGLVFLVVLLVSCYWQPPEPLFLTVKYAGYFVSTITNESTGDVLISYGYANQVVDMAEAFPNQKMFAVTAIVLKGSFGEYVDLGTLTAQLGDQMDIAPFGDPRADIYWISSR